MNGFPHPHFHTKTQPSYEHEVMNHVLVEMDIQLEVVRLLQKSQIYFTYEV